MTEPLYIRIQRLMARNDITQSELARRMGVTRTCVNAWYWGVNQPNAEKLCKLRRIFGCDWKELMGE
jgi:transcriptional regulator with XRE-family HTH domain